MWWPRRKKKVQVDEVIEDSISDHVDEVAPGIKVIDGDRYRYSVLIVEYNVENFIDKIDYCREEDSRKLIDVVDMFGVEFELDVNSLIDLSSELEEFLSVMYDALDCISVETVEDRTQILHRFWTADVRFKGETTFIKMPIIDVEFLPVEENDS